MSVEAVSESVTLDGGKVLVLPRDIYAGIKVSENGLKLVVEPKSASHQSSVLVSLIRSSVKCLGEEVYIILSGGMKRDSESVIEGMKIATEGNAGVCFAADPALRSVENATEIPLEQFGISSTSADELARKLILEYERFETVRHTI